MFADLFFAPPPRLSTATQAKQVRQLLSRSQAVRFKSLVAELRRAIGCCQIARIAEHTSAKFIKLRSQGQIESETILRFMKSPEGELALWEIDQEQVSGLPNYLKKGD